MRKALVAAILVAGSGWLAIPAHAALDVPAVYLEKDPSNGRFRPVYEAGGSKTLLTTKESFTAPTISPDGSRVAFAGVVGNGSLGRYAIFLVSTTGSGLVQLSPASFGEFDPTWSPDGNFIVYSSNSSGSLNRSVCCRLVRINVAYGSTTNLTSAIGAIRPDYSPSGSLLAFDNPSGVWTMPAGGGTATLRASAGRDPTFSADGQRLAYVAISGANYSIRSIPVNGGAATTLYSTTQAIESPVWVGDRIYFVQHLGVGYEGRRSVTHRSIPASGGVAVTESTFSGDVAELGLLESDPLRHLVGDVTGEGRDDITSIGNGDRLALESTGSSFTTDNWGALSPSTGWTRHLGGDFNGDGRADTAGFRTADGTWRVSTSTGSSFSTSTWADFSTPSGWSSQIVGDFNGDGRDDIANYFPGNGTWWVSRSTGSSFSTALWADFSTATGWSRQLVGDFNEDGRDDIANYHPSNGTWWISRSTGSGFVTTQWADFSTASGWSSQIVGDFTGDGRADIANFHPANGTWWISRSTGSTLVTTEWADFSTASGWGPHLVGDFNEDGRDDIANYHGSNGTWWVSRSTGSSLTTTLWADFSTASGWGPQIVGDFNEDGRDDIANYHSASSAWWVSRSSGSSFATSLWSP